MLLYDVFYVDDTMDCAVPLPNPQRHWNAAFMVACLRGARAVCVNGDRAELRWINDKWWRVPPKVGNGEE